jgi:hypothetical protein
VSPVATFFFCLVVDPFSVNLSLLSDSAFFNKNKNKNKCFLTFPRSQRKYYRTIPQMMDLDAFRKAIQELESNPSLLKTDPNLGFFRDYLSNLGVNVVSTGFQAKKKAHA